MKYDHILFDLDGTLTDSAPGILNCAAYALEHMGITPPPMEDLRFFVGPPLLDSFMGHFNMSEEDAWKAIELYRERFRPIGIYENAVYEGIPEALARFQKAGIHLYLATSKPKGMAETVLKYFDLYDYFDVIVGATEDGKLSKKNDIIEDMLRRLSLSEDELKRVCMVGDRKYDMEGARYFDLDCLGVYWGYADPGELEAAGATHVVHSISEMEDFFLL